MARHEIFRDWIDVLIFVFRSFWILSIMPWIVYDARTSTALDDDGALSNIDAEDQSDARVAARVTIESFDAETNTYGVSVSTADSLTTTDPEEIKDLVFAYETAVAGSEKAAVQNSWRSELAIKEPSMRAREIRAKLALFRRVGGVGVGVGVGPADADKIRFQVIIRSKIDALIKKLRVYSCWSTAVIKTDKAKAMLGIACVPVSKEGTTPSLSQASVSDDACIDRVLERTLNLIDPSYSYGASRDLQRRFVGDPKALVVVLGRMISEDTSLRLALGRFGQTHGRIPPISPDDDDDLLTVLMVIMMRNAPGNATIWAGGLMELAVYYRRRSSRSKQFSAKVDFWIWASHFVPLRRSLSLGIFGRFAAAYREEFGELATTFLQSIPRTLEDKIKNYKKVVFACPLLSPKTTIEQPNNNDIKKRSKSFMQIKQLLQDCKNYGVKIPMNESTTVTSIGCRSWKSVGSTSKDYTTQLLDVRRKPWSRTLKTTNDDDENMSPFIENEFLLEFAGLLELELDVAFVAAGIEKMTRFLEFNVLFIKDAEKDIILEKGRIRTDRSSSSGDQSLSGAVVVVPKKDRERDQQRDTLPVPPPPPPPPPGLSEKRIEGQENNSRNIISIIDDTGTTVPPVVSETSDDATRTYENKNVIAVEPRKKKPPKKRVDDSAILPPQQPQAGGLGLEEDAGDLVARRAYFVGHFYDRVAEIATSFYRLNERFYEKTLKRYADYVDRFGGNDGIRQKHAELFDRFDVAYRSIVDMSSQMYVSLVESLKGFGASDSADFVETDMDEDSLHVIDSKRKRCIECLMDGSENIAKLYKGQMSSLLPRLDGQFFVLAGLKAVELGIAWFSLSIASKLFEDQYLVQVYTQNVSTPPSLYVMLGYFMGINLAINAVVLLILWVLSYVRNVPSIPSLFDESLLFRFFADYVISLVLLTVVALIVISVIVKKRYFRYDLEGPRAIRAVKEILLDIAIVTTFLPFFFIF